MARLHSPQLNDALRQECDVNDNLYQMFQAELTETANLKEDNEPKMYTALFSFFNLVL